MYATSMQFSDIVAANHQVADLRPLKCFNGSEKSLRRVMDFSAYAGLVERISESPASRMDIVLHLNSFPQAVPNSICFDI